MWKKGVLRLVSLFFSFSTCLSIFWKENSNWILELQICRSFNTLTKNFGSNIRRADVHKSLLNKTCLTASLTKIFVNVQNDLLSHHLQNSFWLQFAIKVKISYKTCCSIEKNLLGMQGMLIYYHSTTIFKFFVNAEKRCPTSAYFWSPLTLTNWTIWLNKKLFQ